MVLVYLEIGDFWGLLQFLSLMALVWCVLGGGESNDTHGRDVIPYYDEYPGERRRR